jgi:peptidoglycan/xylan/chitin deacetylase (PgdA/CDA1 family)
VTDSLRHPPVLIYHSIAELGGSAMAGRALFGRQMAYLARSGYRTLTPGQFVKAVDEAAWAPKSILLTFDDGYLDVFSDALPILREAGLTATVFLVSDVVDHGLEAWRGPRYPVMPPLMGWSEVLEMADKGICFGSHSASHVHLGGLDADELADEVVRSKAVIEERLDQQIDSIAYPFGDCDNAARSAVRSAGYSAAFGVSPKESQRFEVFRRVIKPARTSVPFRLRVSGAYAPLRRALHIVKGDSR